MRTERFITPEIKKLLAPYEWRLENSKKHVKLLVNGRLVMVFSHGSRPKDPRLKHNTISTIKNNLRLIEEMGKR